MRHGLRQRHAGDSVRHQRSVQLGSVWSAPEQVRESRLDHEDHVRHRQQGGGIRPRLLLHRPHDVRERGAPTHESAIAEYEYSSSI